MNVGIYNRWLHVQGGGERQTGVAANALAAEHDVTFITHRPVDLVALGEKLNVDLSQVKLRCVEDLSDDRLAPLTSEYDLFINGSHNSFVPNRARHSIKFVYFPYMGMHTWDGRIRQWVGRHLLRELRVPKYRQGFFDIQEYEQGSFRWSAESATVDVPYSGWKRDTPVQIVAGSFRPEGRQPANLRIACQGKVLAEAKVNTAPGKYENIDITIPKECIERGRTRLNLSCDTITARDAGFDEQDYRRVGIAVAGVRTLNWRYYVYELVFERLFPGLRMRLHGIPENPSSDFIRTYDLICPNSEFTSHWVEKAWGAESTVLYPPVNVGDLRPGEKRPIILSVGRFYPFSHEKKFPEMIQAFASLSRHQLTGWELHLAGGVAQDSQSRDYFRRVQDLAEGLPVVLHPNIGYENLRQLYGEASLYWHAAGYGVNAKRHPERLEHFGITPVEAMAAGCVPVVLAKGGLAEIVEHNKSGFLWSTLDELKEFSLAAIADPALSSRLRTGAIQRAKRFSEEAYAKRLLNLVAELVSRPDKDSEATGYVVPRG